MLKIWDLQRFKFMASLKGHCNVVRTGVFSQDSRLVVSGGQDKSLRLWDVSQGKQVYCLPAHSDDVTQVRFQDNLIYSASKSIIENCTALSFGHGGAEGRFRVGQRPRQHRRGAAPGPFRNGPSRR